MPRKVLKQRIPNAPSVLLREKLGHADGTAQISAYAKGWWAHMGSHG